LSEQRKVIAMKKVLIVNVNWLGDAIMMTPAIEALKSKYPEAFLAIMGVERIKEVFDDNPYVDEFICFNEKTTQRSFFAKLRFISLLKSKNFDTVFLIQRSFTRALICFLAGIGTRIGFKRVKNNLILTQRIDPPATGTHRQEHYLRLFQASGIEITDKQPCVYLDNQISAKAIARLGVLHKNFSHLIGIHVGANWDLKRWPVDSFACVCDRLTKELKVAIVFFGSEKDKDLVGSVLLKMKEKAYNFCETTTLKELAAIIRLLQLFISADSGPAHLSGSLGTPTLVLFGPTSEKISSPIGGGVKILRKDIDCEIPCYKLNCKDNVCMKSITIEDVFDQSKSMLGL
tara:strand:+ start:215 stop:1249 length:1035 start_codon:yes stop_codon:yes gene_type:complete